MAEQGARVSLPVLSESQVLNMARYSAAWDLLWEYLAWRREQGLEPPRERLNRWHAAWESLGGEPGAE
jgi:hypothetical protein